MRKDEGRMIHEGGDDREMMERFNMRMQGKEREGQK